MEAEHKNVTSQIQELETVNASLVSELSELKQKLEGYTEQINFFEVEC